MKSPRKSSSIDRRAFLATTGTGLLAASMPLVAKAENSSERPEGPSNSSAANAAQTSSGSLRKIPIGVFDPVYDKLPLDEMLERVSALGLEAMSRGAAFALLIDDGAEARALIRQNVEALGLGGITRIFRRDATRLGAVHPNEPFGLVFVDPPYRKGLAEKSLTSLRDGGWLAPDALVIVEEATDAAFAAPDGFAEIERRRYDDTEFTFLRVS